MDAIDQLAPLIGAIIKPHVELAVEAFRGQLEQIRYSSEGAEWQRNKAVEGAVGSYASRRIDIVFEAIVKAVRTRRSALTSRELEALFDHLKPNVDELRTSVYQTANGLGFGAGPGFGIAFDNACRRSSDNAKAELALLTTGSPTSRDPADPGKEGDIYADYQFHPEIERVSGALFRNRHYKQAALEAYICVIAAVRIKSGLALDGDDLMNRAFGSDRRTPALQVNALSSDAERDEQRGFMYLFKGLVGLRNLKAHSNVLFDDEKRAHEYLALSSLLLRMVELCGINVPT